MPQQKGRVFRVYGKELRPVFSARRLINVQNLLDSAASVNKADLIIWSLLEDLETSTSEQH